MLVGEKRSLGLLGRRWRSEVTTKGDGRRWRLLADNEVEERRESAGQGRDEKGGWFCN